MINYPAEPRLRFGSGPTTLFMRFCAFVYVCVFVCVCAQMGGGGEWRGNRIMRLQCCEATKLELVALNELLFCLRPFDYLGGSRGCDFIHISNPNLVIAHPHPPHRTPPLYTHTLTGKYMCVLVLSR